MALGAAMDKMAKEIDESRRALADKERLAREMEIAARIQTSILPRNITVEGLEIAARMMTATEVGGDYYDVLADRRRLLDRDRRRIGPRPHRRPRDDDGADRRRDARARRARCASPSDVLKTLNRVLFENVHDRLEAERHMTLSLRFAAAASSRSPAPTWTPSRRKHPQPRPATTAH